MDTLWYFSNTGHPLKSNPTIRVTQVKALDAKK